jgi:predicted phage tail protein
MNLPLRKTALSQRGDPLRSSIRSGLRGAGGGSGGSQHAPVEQPDSLRSIAYARILDLVSEGEIEGFALGPDRALECIYLDKTPIGNADGSLNFQNVQVDSRSGTQDQTFMAGFPAVENETAISVELKYGTPFVRSITDLDLTALRVRLSVPAGLQKSNTSTGDINGYSVAYTIEIQADSGAYVQMVSGAFTGKASGIYERSHRIDLPAATTSWNVRITRTTTNANSATVADATDIESVTEIVDGKFRYPNSACVGIVVDASQFQNVPTRGYHLKGRIVSVPSNYDPVARTYSGTWDGSFKPSYTNNPAWVYNDVATNPRFALGDRVSAAQVNKWALYPIGQYCDGSVPDGKGGTEPRMTCNVYLQTRADAYKVLNDLATVFRGMSYYANGMIQANADMPADPVYTYTEANTVSDSNGITFSYQGAARATRFTQVLVSWNDPSNFYAPAVEVVQDLDGVARFGIQQTEVTAIGCTSQGQAQRFGRWTLLTSRYESETCTFTVGLDGTLCLPGHVVRIADPNRMGRRVAGRISAATATSLTVDQLPVVSIGDTITGTLPSGITESHAVTAISGNTISIAGPGFSVTPVPQSIWLVESSSLTAPTYRILSRKDNGDLTYTFTSLRNIASKYSAIDNGTIITIPPTSLLLPKVQPAPASVTMTSAETAGSVNSSTVLTIAWPAAAYAASYLVEYQCNHGEWVPLPARSGLTADVRHVQPGDYIARVTARNAIGNSSLPRMSGTYTVVDQTLVPESVSAAAAAASAAAAAAAAANAQIALISSDGVWTPSEKSIVIRDYNVIITEQPGIDAQAVAFGVTTEKTAYDNAVTALASYLPTLTSPTLWSNLAGNTNIVSATARSKFSDVYTTRQTLLNTIYASAKARADAAQATADQANTSAVVQNSNFTVDLTAWSFTASPGPVAGGEFFQEQLTGSPYAPIPTYLVHTGKAGQTSAYADNASNIPVQPKQQVIGVVALRALGANSTARAQVYLKFYDASGTYLDFIGGVPLLNPSSGPSQLNCTAKGSAPANAAFVSISILYTNHTSGYITATCARITPTLSDLDDLPDKAGGSYQRTPVMPGSSISVANANFEAPSDPQGNIPGWIPDTGATLAYNTSAPYSGAQCLEITGHGSANFGARTPSFQCAAGDVIYAQCQAYGVSGNAASLAVVFLGAGGTVLFAPNVANTPGYGTWTLLQGTPAKAPAGTTSAYIKAYNSATAGVSRFDEVHVSRNDVRVAGSGARLGDMRNQVMVGVGNYGAGWTGAGISYSASTTSATISVAAGTLQTGPTTVAYSASSATVSGSAGLVRTYYLYYDDDAYVGGSKTLNATTSQITSLSANGRVLVGTVTVTFPTSGTGTGSGGAGCPDENAWVLRADSEGMKTDWCVRASEVEVGHYLRLTDGRAGLVTHSKRKASPRVRVSDKHGRSLTCSPSAPLELADSAGDCVLAPQAAGSVVRIRAGSISTSTRVGRVEDAGDGYVQHITCQNACFWTGDDPECLFGHHNLKPLGP